MIERTWDDISDELSERWKSGEYDARFGHYVYRHRAADGELLYVGYTSHGATREAFHRWTSEWHHEVATVLYAEHPSKAEALAAESAAIESEDPAVNGPSGRWLTRKAAS